jgi:maltose alpha-D-glucosyltransferase/alpha-amylase
VRRGRRTGLLTDAFALSDFARQVIAAMAAGTEVRFGDGVIHFRATETGRAKLANVSAANVHWLAAEQSNSSLTVGDAAMLKIYRRISPGQHPEAEVTLSDGAGLYARAVASGRSGSNRAGRHTLHPCDRARIRQQRGRRVGLDYGHFRRAHGTRAQHSGEDLFADCYAILAAIGRRLGEMHATLAHETADPAFAPEIASAADVADWGKKTEERLQKAFDSIAQVQTWERELDRERAQRLLSQRESITLAVRDLATSGAGTVKTRIHGDFHLGQVLVASGDAFLIDFEGEPAASLKERRAKTTPLRDVAGLLRSIDYVTATVMDRKTADAVPMDEAQRDELSSQFGSRGTAAFLSAYGEAAGSQNGPAEHALLGLFLIEKAAYEVAYEAANRPT